MTITAATTDRQIAVRAAAIYYADGAPPVLCERLVAVAKHLDSMPEGNWPESVQARRQAKESFDRLDGDMARRIVDAAKSMDAERARARRQRELSLAGKMAAPYQPLVDAIVAVAANERPNNDEHFVGVVAAAYPYLPREVAAAISRACVCRLA
ncbi:MAG TPA: hypothetical protein VFW87_09530 [Pirellulales bacterium]|nr:hypothetical protein [Pirellulales bacterium]